MNYRGWKIEQGPEHPVTGRWRATRYGVEMCAGDEPMLKRMIDSKLEAERQEREEREMQKQADDWSRRTPAGGEA